MQWEDSPARAEIIAAQRARTAENEATGRAVMELSLGLGDDEEDLHSAPSIWGPVLFAAGVVFFLLVIPATLVTMIDAIIWLASVLGGVM